MKYSATLLAQSALGKSGRPEVWRRAGREGGVIAKDSMVGGCGVEGGGCCGGKCGEAASVWPNWGGRVMDCGAARVPAARGYLRRHPLNKISLVGGGGKTSPNCRSPKHRMSFFVARFLVLSVGSRLLMYSGQGRRMEAEAF